MWRVKSQKRGGRVSEEALFTRIIYYGTVQLNRREEEVWLMPIGYLMDLWNAISSLLGLPSLKESPLLMR